MKVVIVKYNAGNIQSVLYALERIGVDAVVTDDHEDIVSADKVIFPGVGEASTAMSYLKQRNIDQLIKQLKQPVLGICLGMQLMCKHSEENDTDCLGIFDERVKRFSSHTGQEQNSSFQEETYELASVHKDGGWKEPELKDKIIYKIPQIGWNTVFNLKTGLFRNVAERSYIYLVHSYYASLGDHTIATADYVQFYSAALHRDNFYGVQFHPEKSAEAGEQILRNFIEYL
ncbi:MAG: imidazole glycerol phosphate synthase subunit HisH [Chitinophagaceae bacterium]